MLCRIEAVLSSRPLTPMLSSPMDLDYLTSGHFIIGQPILAVPDLIVPEVTVWIGFSLEATSSMLPDFLASVVC